MRYITAIGMLVLIAFTLFINHKQNITNEQLKEVTKQTTELVNLTKDIANILK